MMSAFLRRLTDAAWIVVALLALATAVRLGLVGLDLASAADAESPEKPSARRRNLPPPTTSLSADPRVEKPLRSEAVVMTLAVTVGPARSDVHVNRERVGQTPFFGDISCKTSEPLRIEVVPAEAALLSFERACRRGLLRIDRPDGEDPLTAPER
jgi:hypothetical protein